MLRPQEADIAERKRVLSGMRPTGRLHIGHFFGALQNWVKLQEQYECFYFVADWHALTSDYADTSQIARNTIEIGIDWLAAGLDPAKCTLFVQSQVPEHAELHLLLSMITPLGWLERVPTYKEQLDNVKDKDLHTYGFLGYPLLQTADIVIYDADFVPVGEDQAPHVEMSRETVRRFNFFYGLEVQRSLFDAANWKSARALLDTVGWPSAGKQASDWLKRCADGNTDRNLRDENPEVAEQMESWIRRTAAEAGYENFQQFLDCIGNLSRYIRPHSVLCEPRVLLTETPRIPGTDGRKMSKSYGNAIELGEDDQSIREKARNMMTDPARKRRTDKGNPDVCPVFSWHKLFSPQGTIDRVNKECRTAEIGCVDCKGLMADGLVRWIAPIRERRKEYEAHPARVLEILDDGSKKARRVAQATMERVREAIFGSLALRKEIGGGAKTPGSSAAKN